jgi:hypothetical protein
MWYALPELRYVIRYETVATGVVGGGVIAKEVTVLQQKWESAYIGDGAKQYQEWRDVPIVKE